MSSLPKPPAKPAHFGFLQTFRGVAILAVLLYHSMLDVSGDAVRFAGGWWDPAAFDTPRAVLQFVLQCLNVPILFILVSGFVVHLSFSRRQGSLGPFVLQRFARLYLPYLVVLLIFGLLYPATRLGNAGTNAEQVAYHALLLFNFVQPTLWGINPSFWYVATEIQLCLLYPFVLFGIRRIGWTRTLAVLLILELGIRVANSAYTLLTVPDLATSVGESWVVRNGFAYVFTWTLGAWIAERWSTDTLARPSAAMFWLWSALIVLCTAWQPAGVLAWSATALAGASGLALLLTRHTVSSGAPVSARWNWLDRPVKAIGGISYGVYLLNQPVIADLRPWVAGLTDDAVAQILLLSVAAAAVLFPVGFAFTHWIEAPLVKWANGTLPGGRAKSRPAVPDTALVRIRRS